MAKTLTKVQSESSSIPETRPDPQAPASGRQRLRRKAEPAIFYAYPAPDARMVSCLGGRRYAHPGDWLITNENGVLVDILPPDALQQLYESAEPTGALTLSPEQVTRCAKSLRLGATNSPAEFTQAVESLAHVSIGGVDVVWTPGQIAELKLRAAKRNQSVEQYVQYLVDRFCQDMWAL